MNAFPFEWDDRKAAENYANHGISFEMARDVFKDPFAVEWLDEREDYGEERFAVIGMAGSPPPRRLYDEGRHHAHYLCTGSRTL